MAQMAEPGELQNLIDQALLNDKIYQTMLKGMAKLEPGSNSPINPTLRLIKARKELIIKKVKAENPQARRRGGMINGFKRGYRTNKF